MVSLVSILSPCEVAQSRGSSNAAAGMEEERSSAVSIALSLQKSFRSQGWNVAGANLLAVSCWQARSVYLYFRPMPEASDVALAAGLALVGALTTVLMGALVGLAAGAAYLLWKASLWRPAEEIIRSGMDRRQQSDLVAALVDLCQRNSLDPEDLEDMVASLGDRGSKTFSQFHASLVNFFKYKLNMRE